MTSRVVIIDHKIGDEQSIRSLSDDLNKACRPLGAEVTVFAYCDSASDSPSLQDAAVLFLHHGNLGWLEFATKYCSGKDVVLTSTVPDERELRKLAITPPARLLARPVNDREDWLRLPWQKAIKAWREGAFFPLDAFEQDRQWPEDLVAVYLALVAANRGVNVLPTLAPGVWAAANLQMLELVSAYGSPDGGWQEFDAEKPNENISRLAGVRDVLTRMERIHVP